MDQRAGWEAPEVLATASGARPSFGRRLGPPLLLLGVLLAVALIQAAITPATEPCFKNDETRHLMTGVFFRDFYSDRPLGHPVRYVSEYYLQYPALGLVVWPPLFYAVEGAFMLPFGTSIGAGKALVGLFAGLGCVYLYLLASRTHGRATGLWAAALLGVSPMFFEYSRRVMLEVPTLALALGAIYHAVLYLDGGKRRQVFAAGLLAAGAALTRFDGVFLLAVFGALLLLRRRLVFLRRGEVWAAAAVALLIAVPAYAITALNFGHAHLKAVKEGTFDGASTFLAPSNFLFYPARLPEQVGWAALIAAALGLVLGLRPSRRAASWPYLAAIAGVYLTFSPLAELDPRHTIYWIPAIALFAAEGARAVGGWLSRRAVEARWIRGRALPWIAGAPAAALLLATGLSAATRPSVGAYLRGYEDAARYVVSQMGRSRFCFFDGYYEGNFIYQMRRADPERRLWVLRGDKLLYAVMSDPRAELKIFADSDQKILDAIYQKDPELIVVEDRQPYREIHAATRLRHLLQSMPERFRLERTFPIDTNYKRVRGTTLLVYRNLLRNPAPDTVLEFELLGPHRKIGAPVPREERTPALKGADLSPERQARGSADARAASPPGPASRRL